MGTRALRGHWRDGRVRSSTGPALIASQTFSQARTRSEEGLVGLAPPRSPALGSERHDTTGGRERPPFSFFGSLPGGPAELTKNLVSSVGFFCRKKNWIPRKFLDLRRRLTLGSDFEVGTFSLQGNPFQGTRGLLTRNFFLGS